MLRSRTRTLILPILEIRSIRKGKIGSVTVGVITSNYEEFSLSLDVFARNKIVPRLDSTLVSASDITYRRTLSESKLTVTGKMKDTMTTGEEVPGTFAWKDGRIPAGGEAAMKPSGYSLPTRATKIRSRNRYSNN